MNTKPSTVKCMHAHTYIHTHVQCYTLEIKRRKRVGEGCCRSAVMCEAGQREEGGRERERREREVERVEVKTEG